MELHCRLTSQSRVNFPRAMDFFRSRYYTLNRLALSMSGLWPYQHWGTRAVVVTFTLFMLTIALLALICKILTTKCSLDSLSYSLQFTVPDVESISILSYSFINSAKMKALLEHVKADWDLFQPVDTVIIVKYAEIGRSYTLFVMVAAVISAVLQFIALYVSVEMTKKLESNDSYQFVLPLPVEYFIDQEKNYYFILIHIFLALILGMFGVCAVASLYLCCVQHARGLFDIVGHRIETMFDDVGKDVACAEKMGVSIMFHTRAIEFTDILNSMYGPLYMAEMGFLTLHLSSNIFRLFQAYVHFDNVISSALHVIVVLLAMTIASFTGQDLLDHSSNVVIKAYSSQWYLAPTSLQKSLVFIMARGLRESSIKITRSLILSLEFLASVLQIAMSYFMALYSLQEQGD